MNPSPCRIRPAANAGSAMAMAAAMAAVGLFAAPARAEDFFVPSIATPTIQDAVDDAALNAEPENSIHLGAPALFENVSIGGEFHSGHRLTIRPDGAAGLARATVVAAAFDLPVFSLAGAIGSDQGYVTLQDLDILRTGSGSSSHLVTVTGMTGVIIERCRVGLNWTTPGPNGFSNLRIAYPTRVVVRNCIFFSLFTGNFDHGIHVINMSDPDNSILLYNNLVADYRLSGIRVDDGAAVPSAIVLLRNNIAVNHMALVPEPVGYRSEVDDATIVSSHNVVFATPGNEESLAAGAGSIGAPDSHALRFLKPDVVGCFTTANWTLAPPWNANPAFFRLNPAGPLHQDAGDHGLTVDTDGAPNVNDIANVLDIHREGRPGGVPTVHTDRGPDQVDPAAATGIESAALGGGEPAGEGLRVAPERNPSREIALEYTSPRAGTLPLELFELSGRRLAATSRDVSAGERGSWRAGREANRAGGAAITPGIVFYRAVLRTPEGLTVEAVGKAAAIW